MKFIFWRENYFRGSKTIASDELAIVTKSHLHFPVALEETQQFAICIHFSGMIYRLVYTSLTSAKGFHWDQRPHSAYVESAAL